jgi:hypothetical protein
VIKHLIGCFSRWVRRASGKYCTIELDKDARGLARCLVPGSPTKEEKDEKYREQLLRGVDDEDKDKVLEHFNRLRKEADPLEGIEEISDDSVKRVNTNISIEDVQARTRKVSEHYNEQQSKADAENAIRGNRPWPVPPADNTKRKN